MVTFLGDSEFGDRDSALVDSVVASWIRRDREAALAWAEGQTLSEGARLSLVKGIAGSLVETDPDGAADYVTGLGSAAERESASAALLSGWASKDAAAAERWIGESLAEAERPAAYDALVTALAGTDLAEATRLFNEHPPAEGSNPFYSGARQIAYRWALTDPQAAADWATSITDSRSRLRAIKAVSENWARTTPRDASEWVSNHFDPGPERDIAVHALATQILVDDPPAAFEWASSISDTRKRDNFLTDVTRYWRESDPAAARAAVNASDIPTESRTMLLSELPGG